VNIEGRRPSDCTGERINPSAWLIAPTISLLLGQAIAVAPWPIPPEAAAVSLLPLFLIGSPRWRRRALLLALSSVALSVGYVRHRDLLFPEFPQNHLRSVMAREDAPLYLEGTLRHEPEKLISRSRWQVAAERIWHRSGAEEITGDMLVTLRAVHRDWRYGDRVRFWLRPLVPQNSGNPGGFDYATYLTRRAIYVTGFLDNDQEVELLARHSGALRVFVEDLRREIRRFIEGNLSRDTSGLLTALVVGDMGSISKETRAAFTAAGVNHVLSISGLHVAMLGLVVFVLIRYGAQFSTFLMLRLNLFKLAAFFSLLAVLFYTALAGAMVPTVRSAIMIGVYQLAVLLDREEEVFASLTLAALLIALVWPGVVADISFQLSFLAVLFIVWGMRRFYEWRPASERDELPQERSWFRARLRQASVHLAVPLLATLGTGPLIAHYFGHLSLAGFIANPLVVPLVGFIVVPLGLIIGFFAVLAPQAGLLFAGMAEKLVGLTAWLVHLFANLPLANFGVPSPNALEIALLYGLLVGFFAFTKRAHRMTVLAIGVGLLTVDGFYWWNERDQRKELRITHLNVGQGDAAVVELPGSKVMLIDAGGTAVGDFDTGEAIVAPYLRSRKILKVDYLVVTHPRVDHYGGMRAIASEFSPQEFWSGAARGQTGRFDDLEEALEQAKILRVAIHDRQPCRVIDRVRLCALYPPADKSEDGSVVLRLEYGKLRYLFAGDIDKRDETTLLQRMGEVRSAVLKVPRHGGPTASTAEFVTAVRPALAVISAGGRGRNEAQREEVAERYQKAGAEVFRTSSDGAIIIESDGNKLRYRGYKSGRKGEIDLIASDETKTLTTESTKGTK
jgi:competence protein ComEC